LFAIVNRIAKSEKSGIDWITRRTAYFVDTLSKTRVLAEMENAGLQQTAEYKFLEKQINGVLKQ